MMTLAILTFGKVVIGVLCISLAILILAIAYRKLLAYLGKGTPPKEDYCVLHSLEKNPAKDEVSFYFTAEKEKSVQLNILDENYTLVKEIKNDLCHIGGNVIRFQSTELPNGNYYYCLVTDNQKTLKKMTIAN